MTIKICEDEKRADEEFKVAEELLDSASKRLTEAIEREDMLGIKIAKELMESARKTYSTATEHKNQQKAVRIKLGEKRKFAMAKLVKGVKIAKK